MASFGLWPNHETKTCCFCTICTLADICTSYKLLKWPVCGFKERGCYCHVLFVCDKSFLLQQLLLQKFGSCAVVGSPWHQMMTIVRKPGSLSAAYSGIIIYVYYSTQENAF